MSGNKQLAAPLLGVAGFGALLLPGALRLPAYRPAALNGVKTMDDAVAHCAQTGLRGWELVAYAQKLVARKFHTYSALNLWDPPGRAFLYGMGYCTQYNLALNQLLDRLGVATKAVFSLQVRVFDEAEWTMGHTWLRVTVDGETRDVCAGRVENEPGNVHFAPIRAVYPGRPFTLFLTHLGMILFCGALGWRALLTRRPLPDWMFVPRDEGELAQIPEIRGRP